MKRRNADCGKLRRPLKRGKIPDSFYGSLFMYMKFVMVWLLVLLADFILEFRFEYLWPFWLLVRSVYDSFKYQGLAFSVFFVCIALTSDMICFLFIPVHWLFFAASTYVWVQFVWHTERGICLPTVSLWLLFVYIEASIRLRELKNLPFHLDLCRPFASHCIGYPVVTLGFGFKSYVGYRMRQRKQKEVAKENEFYMQLIKQALPQEQQCTAVTTTDKVTKSGDEVVSNGVSPASSTSSSTSSATSLSLSNSKRPPPPPPTPRDVTKFAELDPREAKKQQILGTSGNSALEKELEYMENELSRDKRSSVNDYDESTDVDKDKSYKSNGVVSPHTATTTTTVTTTAATASATATTTTTTRSSPPSRAVTQQQASHHHHQPHHQQQQQQQQHHQQHHHHQHQHHIKENKENVIALNSQQQPQQQSQQSSQRRGGGGSKNNAAVKDGNVNNFTNQKDDHTLRLEADIKRLKADLQASRQCELDLRSQLNTLATGERSVKNELVQFQQDNENLQAKLHGLVTARQHDKQCISNLEKKLQDERRFRSAAETQLNNERKMKKVEAEAASRAAAAAVVVASSVNARQECTENCKARKRELDNDNKQLRRELKMCEDRVRQAEREVQALRQYKESHNEAEVLMSALSAMQDKNAHLENSLSAETRLKLDLFSALGDAKRQLEISQALLAQKCKEIDELKSRIAEVMAVMPSTTPFPPVSLDTSSLHRSTSNANNHVHHAHAHYHHHHHHASKFVTDDTSGSVSSNLDPNASVYTPKSGSGVSPIDEI